VTLRFQFYFILLFPVGQSAKNPFSGAHVRAAVFSVSWTQYNGVRGLNLSTHSPMCNLSVTQILMSANMSLKSPPMMRVDENVNGTATFSGIDYDIFDLIMKKLNLT
jgi:hypothetical protein